MSQPKTKSSSNQSADNGGSDRDRALTASRPEQDKNTPEHDDGTKSVYTTSQQVDDGEDDFPPAIENENEYSQDDYGCDGVCCGFFREGNGEHELRAAADADDEYADAEYQAMIEREIRQERKMRRKGKDKGLIADDDVEILALLGVDESAGVLVDTSFYEKPKRKRKRKQPKEQ